MDIVVVTGRGAGAFVAEQAKTCDLVLDTARLQQASGGSAVAVVFARIARDDALKRLNLADDVGRVWVPVSESEDALSVHRKLRRRASMIVVD